MCRWLAYSGSPVLLEELLYGPKHSLIVQSLHSQLGAEETNGDGFGIGWYGAQSAPAVFHSTEPAWNDRNLRELAGHISSGVVFAHVRASTGSPVQQTNCHPFRHGRWLWMHNGLIHDFHEGEARPLTCGRPGALPRDRRHDRLRDLLPPRAHAGPRRRPAGSGRACCWADRRNRACARRRAPDPDDGRDDRWRPGLGLPLLESGQVAIAVLQHRPRHPSRPVPGQSGAP